MKIPTHDGSFGFIDYNEAVDDTYPITCPACGEESDIGVDFSGGEEQEYLQGCPVC